MNYRVTTRQLPNRSHASNNVIYTSCHRMIRSTLQIALTFMLFPAFAWANPNPPQFSPTPGNYTSPLSVTISDQKSSNAVIYYTTDGTTPTTSSPQYSSPVSLSTGTTLLQAVAYISGRYSTVTSGSYTVTAGGTPLITVSAGAGIAINPQDYGANNIWYYVPSTSFDTFSGSLKSNAGVTLMRYPGGYESEHYEWSNNTLDSTYKNYTSTPGATPAQIIGDMGNNNVSFVVRTEDALEANDASDYQTWANQAASLVTQYGGQVRDWQIGNEWFNDAGAHTDYAGFLQRYATLVSYYAPAMKAAAAQAGYSIRIYITCNWINPGDMTTMQGEVGSAAWADVDGIDLHIYTGINPSQSKFYVPLPISSIQPTIAQIKTNSGKQLVYVSEWMADLEDNNNYGGLQDANVMMQIFGQFAQSGITEAAYWPPVSPTTWNGTNQPQADTVTLVNDSSSYYTDADGQAMQWLSSNYQGESLSTTVANSTVTSIAAKTPDNKVVVFVMGGGSASNETDQVQVSGLSWSTILSAQVLYATGSNVSSGPATVSNIPASVVQVGGQNTAQFVINPGSAGRGSAWEIVKLVLQ